MRKITLVVKEDDETGETGLILAPLLNNRYLSGQISVASEGLQIAHDLMEHQNGLGEIGRIDDELQALAGIWFIRGQFGVLRHDRMASAYTIQENIAADVLRMYTDTLNGAETIHAPRGIHTNKWDSHIGSVMDLCTPEQLHDYAGSEDCVDSTLSLAESYYSAALYYMREGAIKANQRCVKLYGGNFARMNAQFWSIAQAVDEIIPQVDFVGQEFTLQYGKGDAVVSESQKGWF